MTPTARRAIRELRQAIPVTHDPAPTWPQTIATAVVVFVYLVAFVVLIGAMR